MDTNLPSLDDVRRRETRGAIAFTATLVASSVLLWWMPRPDGLVRGLPLIEALRALAWVAIAVLLIAKLVEAARTGYVFTTSKLVLRRTQPVAYYGILSAFGLMSILLLLAALGAVLGPRR